jgi:hypothetical protein
VAVRDALAGLSGVVAVEEESGPGETRARLECLPDADPSEEIFHLAVARGLVLRQLTREALSLEDVFVQLMRHDEAAPAAAEPEPASPPPEAAS